MLKQGQWDGENRNHWGIAHLITYLAESRWEGGKGERLGSTSVSGLGSWGNGGILPRNRGNRRKGRLCEGRWFLDVLS